MSNDILIRAAETPADYRACQDAQRRAWGLTDEGYVVPVATLVGAQLHGGLVLGAFLPSGEAVGVSFAFLGWIEERLGLYSQLTGVVPGYQGHGIGGRLKHYQRDVARQRGLAVIAWAFDPLQAGNAHFNLDRLGATARRCVVDMYGPRTDALNAGAPTDRLIAEWETEASPRSKARAIDGLPALIAESGRVTLDSTVPEVFLEIPEDITRLRRESPALASACQQAVRQAFLSAFDAGYRAVAFLRDQAHGARRCGYLLVNDRAHS
ncbi:MAG: hypothetical protein P4L84_33555 [Isosphaeraceae bacterium]|nr:hypothetical protein [Isosphaeraceae bacterium]